MEEKCGARGNGSSTWKLADGILLQKPVERGLVSIQLSASNEELYQIVYQLDVHKG